MKCRVCGKEITEKGRRVYCSKACAEEGNRINARGSIESPRKPAKCKHCGKEFVKKSSRQLFCCFKCHYEYATKKRKLINRIKSIAKENNFELKNMDKIVRAKMMLFGKANPLLCPCSSNNPNRYCGSALCIADTIYKGHCHCSMMYAKKTLQDYENGL